jgi:hypothetical protein
VKIRNVVIKKLMYCLKMIKCDYFIAINTEPEDHRKEDVSKAGV